MGFAYGKIQKMILISNTLLCELSSLWGQKSIMCRVILPDNDAVKKFRDEFKQFIELELGNGCDNNKTFILDVPWSNENLIAKLEKYYNPQSLNIHFHDQYVPPEQNIYAESFTKESQEKGGWINF